MARRLALETLNNIFSKKQYSNLAISKAIKDNDLNDKDNRLFTEIVYGVLKNKMLLDNYLKPYLEGKVLKDWTRHLLALSIYQILFLDKVPKYAIINDAVEIAKEYEYTTSKLINAVLRNFDVDCLYEPPNESVEYSINEWLYKQIKGQYKDDYLKILKSFNDKPKLSARVNSWKIKREKLLNENIKLSKISKDGVIFAKGNIANSSEYQRGLVSVQDESSQLVSLFLNPSKNDIILDVCSAPGGKTTHIAELMENQGTIYANDIHEHKIELIKGSCTRLGITNVEFTNYDGTKLKKVFLRENFDKILLDVPCSGWGVIARKPEIKYFQNNEKVEAIRAIQISLLNEAAVLLKINGCLVYSTCTLNKGENEVQIKNFLKNNSNFELVEEKLILPYENNTDGFYMAKIKKVKR